MSAPCQSVGGGRLALGTYAASLSWLAGTPEEVLSGIRAVAAEAVEDMKKNGETGTGSHRGPDLQR
jgi:hypothetical protein